jgi:hypothetical protein
MTEDEKIKVFISYSWDGDAHKEWVLNLADRLSRYNSIHVYFDRYDLHAGKNMVYFMENSVNKSDKVLLILTPNYKLKAENAKGGVGAEYSMITAKILENQLTDKFIPILRNGDRNMSCPLFIKSRIDIDMRTTNTFETNDINYKQLLDAIRNISEIERPVSNEDFDFIIHLRINDKKQLTNTNIHAESNTQKKRNKIESITQEKSETNKQFHKKNAQNWWGKIKEEIEEDISETIAMVFVCGGYGSLGCILIAAFTGVIVYGKGNFEFLILPAAIFGAIIGVVIAVIIIIKDAME